jgi:hypothetical protein
VPTEKEHGAARGAGEVAKERLLGAGAAGVEGGCWRSPALITSITLPTEPPIPKASRKNRRRPEAQSQPIPCQAATSRG